MKKPVLVIMAAGMGSRYGGLKQIDPVDEEGHIIIDFSIYDAIRAGFEKIVFIIKKQNEEAFKEAIGNRMEKYIKVEYVYQELTNLPEGFTVPEGRVKPYGTGHAILCCKDVVTEPFAVINADDYYGREAFEKMYDFLSADSKEKKLHFSMVGYVLENTLTENGHVARGVCKTDENGHLVEITERTHIERRDGKSMYTEDDGTTWQKIIEGSTVSMNLWGFTPEIFTELNHRFPEFLKENMDRNPLKCEFFLPTVVSELIGEGKAVVDVMKSKDRWYGVTYHEDKEVVMNAVKQFKKEGIYPEKLWQ